MTDNRSDRSVPHRERQGDAPRRPTAFRLDDERVRLEDDYDFTPLSDEALIIPLEEDIEDQIATVPEQKTSSLFRRFLSVGVGGLVALAIGLAVDSLIRDLFARTDWLGWLAVALAAVAAIGLLGLIIRELAALARLKTIDKLRTRMGTAAEEDDALKARESLTALIALYEERPETAHGRKALKGHLREVIDGRDLVILGERELLLPLDTLARTIVLNSAKRISVITAVSPRAIVDLLAVLFENIRTIRKLSALYGGRPGMLGFLRLARKVMLHLAVTGGMAAGDSLASQVLGHGLAARLSARLGEGVVNGLLTARIGIAAIDVCRPAPFVGSRGPRISDFMSELLHKSEKTHTRGKTGKNAPLTEED